MGTAACFLHVANKKKRLNSHSEMQQKFHHFRKLSGQKLWAKSFQMIPLPSIFSRHDLFTEETQENKIEVDVFGELIYRMIYVLEAGRSSNGLQCWTYRMQLDAGITYKRNYNDQKYSHRCIGRVKNGEPSKRHFQFYHSTVRKPACSYN
ncbi:hypothetical protein KIN20_002842 [Parelaphostrongylus tenuis]|uniref:Uncharacterized protein n=1 Tax=Parelaphostrongylus tenuis TaxID=148309 RepID=A0AAD5QH12_PARTN|nr:hypothetical protein KIN20_002842 [Parelaphostrongylus tenuis]